MVDFAAACKQLRVEVETLKEENRQLRKLLFGDTEIPWDWGLTPTHTAILRCLIAQPEVPYEVIERAIYGDAYQPADMKAVVRTHVRHLRLKLQPRNIEIHNRSGFGYRLDPATRKRLQQDLKSNANKPASEGGFSF
ncbi:winged helix-turn-helix domain-containing protein [Roseibium alexandrii]|uniref:winged helix-turn-helix domain-containing protein n=1 Tax=Roseibium alexandrii TaxID=388408 RepID=UPI003752DA00